MREQGVSLDQTVQTRFLWHHFLYYTCGYPLLYSICWLSHCYKHLCTTSPWFSRCWSQLQQWFTTLIFLTRLNKDTVLSDGWDELVQYLHNLMEGFYLIFMLLQSRLWNHMFCLRWWFCTVIFIFDCYSIFIVKKILLHKRKLPCGHVNRSIQII